MYKLVPRYAVDKSSIDIKKSEMKNKRNSVVYTFDDIKHHLEFLPIMDINDPD